MEIRIALEKDKEQIMQYDRHIHAERLDACINNRLVYALWEADRIVGVLRYSFFWQSVPFLDLLYIDDGFRGKGIGSVAMKVWEDAMIQMGYSYVMLSTQEDETAKFFYEKIGYLRIGAFLPPEQDAEEIMYCKRFSE